MDIESLIQSYRQYLQASIQVREIGSFGGGLAEMFGKTIAEHQAAERAFIDAAVAQRAAELVELKKVSHK